MTALDAHDRQSIAAKGRITEIEVMGPSGRPVPAVMKEVGAGTPIVFFHGLLGLNDHWDQIIDAISERHRCTLLQIPLLDLRGPDCSVAGVTEMTTKFLRENLEQTDIPPILVGNSFGGHVACRIAIAHPDLLRGLVLTGASGLLERPLTETNRFKEVQIKPTREWVVEKIGELYFDRSRLLPEDIDRAHEELNRRQGARAMVRLSRSARKDNLGAELRKLHAQTLLIWGRQDIVTPPEAASEFMNRLPNVSIAWFDRCGHVPMMEHPEVFSEAVLEFARGIDSSHKNGR